VTLPNALPEQASVIHYLGAVAPTFETLTSEAVVVWVSRATSPFPRRDDEAVLTRYGPQLGPKLLAAVLQLDADYYASDAGQRARDLAEMAAWASADFRRLHPDVTEDAVDALEWCYTWDHR
jgi:hypothetical protein